MDWMVVVSALVGILAFGQYFYLWRRYAYLHEGRFLESVRPKLVLYTFAAVCLETFAFLHMKAIGGCVTWPYAYGGLAYALVVFTTFFIGNLLAWMGIEIRPGVDIDG